MTLAPMRTAATEQKPKGGKEPCTRCGHVRMVKVLGRPGSLCQDCRSTMSVAERKAWQA